MSNSLKRAAEDAPASKKSKKKRKGNSQNDESLDTDLGVNTLFARMDNQLLADHLAQKTTRFGSDLSPVEIADLTLSGKELTCASVHRGGSSADSPHRSWMYQGYQFLAVRQDAAEPPGIHREVLQG